MIVTPVLFERLVAFRAMEANDAQNIIVRPFLADDQDSRCEISGGTLVLGSSVMTSVVIGWADQLDYLLKR